MVFLKMFKVLALMLCISMLSQNLFARNYEFSGAGGFTVGFYNPDLDFLHNKIQSVTPGFDKIEGPIITWGGGGYGLVSEHWRIGGYGFGGEKSISGTFTDPNNEGAYLPQDVVISFGGGGFYSEYILGHIFNRLEGAISLGIGGAGVKIKIAQYSNNVTWDGLFEGFDPNVAAENKVIQISNGGILLNPGVGVKFHVNSFFAIEGMASYVMILFPGDWRFEGVTVRDTPDFEFDAPVFGMRFLFGG